MCKPQASHFVTRPVLALDFLCDGFTVVRRTKASLSSEGIKSLPVTKWLGYLLCRETHAGIATAGELIEDKFKKTD